LRFDTIFKHLHAKRATGGHDRRASLDGLLGADMVHPPSNVNFHKRVSTTGAAAQALTLVPAHLLHLDPGQGLERLAWLGKDVVVTSEVARIVVGHLRGQRLRRGQATFLEQTGNELTVVDDLEMTTKLQILVL